MPSIFDRLRGIRDLNRLDEIEDPEERRRLEEEILQQRADEKGVPRKSLFEGIGDAVRTRDIEQGLDVRRELDPRDSLQRRLRESGAEGEPLSQREELQQNVQRVRDIVAKRKNGETVTDEEKRLVFQVITDAVRGLSRDREATLARQQERLNNVADQTVGPSNQPV